MEDLSLHCDGLDWLSVTIIQSTWFKAILLHLKTNTESADVSLHKFCPQIVMINFVICEFSFKFPFFYFNDCDCEILLIVQRLGKFVLP